MSANMTLPTGSGIKCIGVIGGGPAGCSFVANLPEIVRRWPAVRGTKILVFDPRGRFVGGDAFGPTSPTGKLNTELARMGPLEQPGAVAQELRDELPPGLGDAIGRGRYGEYTRTQMETVTRDLADLDVTVLFVAEKVTRIEPQTGGTSGYVVMTGDGRYDVDLVVMASGRLSSPGPREFAGLSSCIAKPWAPGALDAIPRDNRVLILGTSLTTVDQVGRLVANGHRGLITPVARTRGLPTVQNLGNPYRPSVFTHAMVEAITAYGTRRLTLNDVLALLRAELKAAGVADTDDGVDEEMHEQVDLLRRNPHAALLKHIAEAQAGRAIVSAVIGALNDATRFAWPLITDEDAVRLLRYKSLYSMFANAMPLANAQMMERVMAKGLLRVHVGLTAVTYSPDTRLYTATTTDPDGHTLHHEAHTLIVATGNSRRLADGGPLIRQMLADGMIREHPRGGVDITPAGRVIGADGNPATGLWWIGEATEGARLGTNCVRVINHHTRATIEDLTGQI